MGRLFSFVLGEKEKRKIKTIDTPWVDPASPINYFFESIDTCKNNAHSPLVYKYTTKTNKICATVFLNFRYKIFFFIFFCFSIFINKRREDFPPKHSAGKRPPMVSNLNLSFPPLPFLPSLVGHNSTLYNVNTFPS